MLLLTHPIIIIPATIHQFYSQQPMFQTPRKHDTSRQFSTTASRITKRLNSSAHERSLLVHSGSNKSIDRGKLIRKLSISVEKKKFYVPHAQQSPRVKQVPQNYKVNVQSRASSHSCQNVVAYGVSTWKGFRSVGNPHHIGINLGYVKNFTLLQSYDGSFAGNFLKKEYSLQLLTIASAQIKAKPELYLQQVNNLLQERLIKLQREEKDNSGCTLVSVIVDENSVTVSNCGSSHVFCETRGGSFLKLSEQHDTKNQKQIDRIVKNGGIMYRTFVNAPCEKQLSIEGPLRLSPSGLSYTRTLGRGLDYSVEEKCENFGQTITWKPHSTYVKTAEVLWFGIFSESIGETVKKEWIRKVVNVELRKRNESYTEHHIAHECSKKIVHEAINMGAVDAVSAVIVIVGRLDLAFQSFPHKNPSPSKPNMAPTTSLKYIGNRRSFIKSK